MRAEIDDVSVVVFNIQRFSVNDGRGIRTTVFLKGCSLNCGWCSNPEALTKPPQLITRDIKCIRCGKCVEACDRQAISIEENNRVIHWEKCDNCDKRDNRGKLDDRGKLDKGMKCTEVCPSGALEAVGKQMTVAEVLDEVEKDSGYYQRTGGGMTLSGGESMVQWKFALKLLKEAKRRGLHTTLDTTGNTSWDKLDQVLNFADVVLYDVKHLNSAKHKAATGVPNEKILNNLRKAVAKQGPKIWLRHPLIPQFNDSEKDRQALYKFIQTLKPAVEKICLLPYQKYGESKYAAMGMDYPWKQMPAINEWQVGEIKKQIESHGIEVTVGR